MTRGEQIKIWREAKGITLRQLGFIIGQSSGTISHWEHGSTARVDDYYFNLVKECLTFTRKENKSRFIEDSATSPLGFSYVVESCLQQKEQITFTPVPHTELKTKPTKSNALGHYALLTSSDICVGDIQ